MLKTASELMGVPDEVYMGGEFSKLTEQILELHSPETEPPLFLSRELNRKLIPVLDSLGIDYRGADYITDFV